MVCIDPPVPSVRSSPASTEDPSHVPRSTSSSVPDVAAVSSNAPVALANPESWGRDQQQVLEAFMGNLPKGPLGSLAPGLTPPSRDTLPGAPESDPFSAMMAQLVAGHQTGAGAGAEALIPPNFPLGLPQAATSGRKKTGLQKCLPLLHAAAISGLLAYFVIGYEPALFGEGHWKRWSSLRHSKNEGVHPVPIFYAFTTLEVVFHSLRAYLEPAPQPSTGLISMIIANLPPPLPGLIATGSRYFRIGGAILDDLSVLLFGVGLVVWYAGWTGR